MSVPSVVQRLRNLVGHEIYVVRLVALTALKWDRDRSLQQAAALSFQTALALVPAVAVALAWMDPKLLVEFLSRTMLPGSRKEIAALAAFAAKARTGAVGTTATLVLSWFLYNSIDAVWNDVWEVKQRRRLWQRVATFLFLATVGAAAVGFSLYATARYWRAGGLAGHAYSFAVVWAALLFAHWLLPRARVRLEAAAVGGFVAAALFELAKSVFAYYVAHVLRTRAEGIYGPLAVVFLLLVWIYWSWIVALFGAKVAYAVDRAPRGDVDEWRPVQPRR